MVAPVLKQATLHPPRRKVTPISANDAAAHLPQVRGLPDAASSLDHFIGMHHPGLRK